MKCFNHADSEAVATCKFCGKGLCHDCLVESPNGITCKGPCKEKLNNLSTLVAKQQETVTKYVKSILVFVMLGSIYFGVKGVLMQNVFIVVFAAACLVLAFCLYRRMKKISNK